MASRRMYIGGSVLVALLGIGIVIYLARRKPEVRTIETFVFETKVSESAFQQPRSEMERLIQESHDAIVAHDMEQDVAKL